MAIDIVVGSGPTGLAAATALLERGREVLMLDVGNVLGDSAAALRDRLAAVEPATWSASDHMALSGARRNETYDTIRAFGSNFMFEAPPDTLDWAEQSNVHSLRPSFAKGGLSNGWGASSLPYRPEDISDWPVGLDDLLPHYRGMSDLVGVAARPDALSTVFPGATHASDQLPRMSRQSQILLERLEQRQRRAAIKGLCVGQSRQAIGTGCRQCAMCLYGCPYGVIFNAGAAVDRLVRTQGLKYQAGCYVTHFSEGPAGVRVRTADREFTGERVFIACGVLPTTLITLRSLGCDNEHVTLKDSQHFFLPMLHTWSAGDVGSAPLHTLAQQFWEFIDPDIDQHTVHVQIYTYNDTYAPDIRRRFGLLAHASGPLVDFLSRRLIVAQGFLHSDSSPELRVSLAKSGSRHALDFVRCDNQRTMRSVSAARRRMSYVARAAGMLPLTPLTRLGHVGSSFHCGGTFPMSHAPGKLQTDVLGRPRGLRRVHLVDASVFPSIPATTITLSAMANAHRIAAGS